jgi:imidazolonepropionase-like amidohydrolase
MSLGVHTMLAAALCVVCTPALAQQQAATSPPSILFENVRVFDGKSAALSELANVLVTGNVITKISKEAIPTGQIADTKIQGGGRTLMPGLIDAHWHTMLVRPTPASLLTDDVGYLN